MKSQSFHRVNYGSAVSGSMNRQKRRPRPKVTPAATLPAIKPISDPVMDKVRILKRGEVLSSIITISPSNNTEAKHGTNIDTDRLVSMNSRIDDCYAGSAFVTSPEPSSLPLPGFFKKKTLVNNATNTDFDATFGLLRLLRLNLWRFDNRINLLF